jgi:hypothetical protein
MELGGASVRLVSVEQPVDLDAVEPLRSRCPPDRQLELARAEGRSDVEQRARDGGDRHAPLLRPLVNEQSTRAMDDDAAAALSPAAARDDDVNGSGRRRREAPERCRVPVAQERRGTTGEDGGTPASLRPELRVAEGVHAAMEEQELAGADPDVDGGRRNAQFEQLASGDDTMLTGHESSNIPGRGGLTVHMTVKPPRDRSSPP